MINTAVIEMSLKQLISVQYGLNAKKKVTELSRLKVKRAATKNSTIFLERCLSHSIVPTTFRNRCPIRSKRAKRICAQYQINLLKEALYQKRRDFHKTCNKLKRILSYLKRALSDEHFQLVERVSNKTYEASFEKHKERLKKKFEKLCPKTTHQPTRPSVIRNPVLQNQKDPVPPEVIDLLSLGPKFALTPNEVPNMEIIEGVEKSCLAIERKGKKREADTLRHDTTEILLTAEKPKSNLTASQRKGKAWLKENQDKIAVVPFDKGVGFSIEDREELDKKAEAEFKNVSLDTRDTTKALQTKIQNK